MSRRGRRPHTTQTSLPVAALHYRLGSALGSWLLALGSQFSVLSSITDHRSTVNGQRSSMNVLHFHGFASSPASAKITALRPILERDGIELVTPDLNVP